MAGNATIGALKVDLGLNSAQFEAGLKKTQASLSGFAAKAAVAGAAVGAAMAAAGIALGAALKGAIDRADEMDELAQKVGLSVESLTRLKYAAEISGVQLDTLSTGIKKLSQGMIDAAQGGSGKAADALKALGISATDASGKLKGSDVVLTEIAGKFADMQDGAQKTALAMALFGKSGADLLPFLNEGADGIARLTAEADALGITLDSKTAAAAGKFNENLDRLKAVGAGLTNQLAAAMLPALQSITTGLLGAAKNGEVMRGVGVALGATLKVLASAAVVVGVAFSNMGRFLANSAKIATQLFKGDFAGAFETYKSGVAENLKAIGTGAASIQAIWSKAGADVESAAPKVGDQLASPLLQGAGKAKAAGKAVADEAAKAAAATAKYIATLEGEVAQVGLNSNALKRLAADREIEAALKQGDTASAARIKDLILEREKLEDLATALEEAAEAQKDLSKAQVEFVTTPAKLADAIGRATSRMSGDLEKVMDKFFDIRSAMDGVFASIKNKDWASAFSGLTRAAKQIKAAFEEGASAGDKVSAIAGVADAVGNAIGGKAGKGISSAANAGATAFQATGNPYVAAAAAVVAGLTAVLGPKPTNAGAGYDLRNGAVSGDKRTAETERAAVSAGKAVQDAVALIEANGVKFNDSLNALVLGTRDQSYLYFESGKTLRSAVGDSAAAVNTALRALLETATFASDAQAKVAQAALAAGKTFDEVIAELANFDAAQGIGKSIADQILALTDPKAFDVAAVKADIAEQRKAAQAAADKGYLTADALAAVNAQLAQLEDLKLHEVFAKYEAAASDVDWTAALADAADAVAAAQADLASVLESQIGPLEQIRDRFADVADGLEDFGRELRTTAAGGLDPRQQLAAAQAAFDAIKGRTDADSLAQIPTLGRALIEAQRAAAPNARALAATEAEVRRAADAGAAAARDQVSAAEAQIAALRSQIDALGLNTTAIDQQTLAQNNLAAALANQALVISQAAQAIKDATGAASAAMAAAAEKMAANSNAAPIVVPGFDAAAAAAGLGPMVADLAGVSATGSSGLVAALDGALGPYLYAIAKSSAQTAELTQIARDEADAA